MGSIADKPGTNADKPLETPLGAALAFDRIVVITAMTRAIERTQLAVTSAGAV